MTGPSAMAATAALNAANRAAANLSLRRGRFVLASTAAIAPLAGMFLTVLAIWGSFLGHIGPGHTMFTWPGWRLSQALWPTAFCLAVALLASGALAWLDSAVERREAEVRLALSLLDSLLRRWPPLPEA